MVGNSRKPICMKSTEAVSQAMVVVLFPLPGTFVVGWSYFRGLALDRDARFSGAGRGRHILCGSASLQALWSSWKTCACVRPAREIGFPS